MEELRTEAEKLAEERRIARERAMEWTREVQMESDEERERKSKKTKKPKGEVVSGDEAEPKKKRRGKLKKATSEQGDEEHSEEEEAEKPAKKVFISLICWLTWDIDPASANGQETSCSWWRRGGSGPTKKTIVCFNCDFKLAWLIISL